MTHGGIIKRRIAIALAFTMLPASIITALLLLNGGDEILRGVVAITLLFGLFGVFGYLFPANEEEPEETPHWRQI